MNLYRKFHASRNRAQAFLIVLPIITVWMLWPTEERDRRLHPPTPVAVRHDPCIEVRPEFGPYQAAVIQTPGLYCIAVDFWQRRLSDFAGHTGPTTNEHLLGVISNDVTVDLANHILHTDGDSTGIVAVRIQEGKRPVPQNISIKNGVLDIRGLGSAVDVVDHWPLDKINASAPPDFTGFKKSGIVLDNLLIKTDNVGIMLEGDGNIIRNCIIESGGDSAIMMAGPNGQILNNTIILTEPLLPANRSDGFLSQFDSLSKFRNVQRAAIVLHRATGTIISGNRIEVKGTSQTYHNIYLTDASARVHIIGNTIVGPAEVVTFKKGSTAELKSNVVEKTKNKVWWRLQ
ncbi:MAG: right-handed parallel beta-helix repeat-containing protein [Pseudomonadota bacterium]